MLSLFRQVAQMPAKQRLVDDGISEHQYHLGLLPLMERGSCAGLYRCEGIPPTQLELIDLSWWSCRLKKWIKSNKNHRRVAVNTIYCYIDFCSDGIARRGTWVHWCKVVDFFLCQRVLRSSACAYPAHRIEDRRHSSRGLGKGAGVFRLGATSSFLVKDSIDHDGGNHIILSLYLP